MLGACTLALAYPEAIDERACNDGIDNDADGERDCRDEDCHAACFETTEAECIDGRDNDQDGLSDGADPLCWEHEPPRLLQCPGDQETVHFEAFGPHVAPWWVTEPSLAPRIRTAPSGDSALSISKMRLSNGSGLIGPEIRGETSVSFELDVPDGAVVRCAVLDSGLVRPGSPLPTGVDTQYVRLEREGNILKIEALIVGSMDRDELPIGDGPVAVSLWTDPWVEIAEVVSGGRAVRLVNMGETQFSTTARRVVWEVISEGSAEPTIDDIRVLSRDVRRCPRIVAGETCSARTQRVLGSGTTASGHRCVVADQDDGTAVMRFERELGLVPVGSLPHDPGETLGSISFARRDAGLEVAYTVTSGTANVLRIVRIADDCAPSEVVAEVSLDDQPFPSTIRAQGYEVALLAFEPGGRHVYVRGTDQEGGVPIRRLVERGDGLRADVDFVATLRPAFLPFSFQRLGTRELVITGRQVREEGTGVAAMVVRGGESPPAIDWTSVGSSIRLLLQLDPSVAGDPGVPGPIDGIAIDDSSEGGNLIIHSTLEATSRSRARLACLEYALNGLPTGFCRDFDPLRGREESRDGVCDEWESCVNAPEDCGSCVGEPILADALSDPARWTLDGPDFAYTGRSRRADDAPGRYLLGWESGSAGSATLPLGPLTNASIEARVITLAAPNCRSGLALQHERGEVRVSFATDELGEGSVGFDASPDARMPLDAFSRPRITLTAEPTRATLTFHANNGCTTPLELEHEHFGRVIGVSVWTDGSCTGAVDTLAVSGTP